MVTFKVLVFVLLSSKACLAQVFPDKEHTYQVIENAFQELRDKYALAEEEITADEDAVVTIRNGTLQGSSMTVVGAPGKRMYYYRKIPYAAPPTGSLRFEPPQPFLESFNGTRDATVQSPACAQFLTHVQPASEDCLYLSVYTNRPSTSEDKSLRPVMVYLHGGAFVLGETSFFSGRRLVAEDIIVVVPAYRLSVFGFFSTGDTVVPDNMALKDAVQALRWIQENIEAFGGDPNQVTISGESAGSALASYITISPLAQGLFHRALLFSGVANAEWGVDRNPRLAADLLAKAVNCSTESTTEMVRCLKGVPWKTLSRVGVENLVDRILTSFRIELPDIVPVIEVEHPGAFLTEDPIKILQENMDLPRVPMMLGSVQHEGVLPMAILVYLAGQPWGLIYDKHWLHHDMISQLMSVYGVDDSKNGGTLSQTVALTFFPDSARNSFEDMAEGMLDMLSVAFMKAPILRKTEILTERGHDMYIYSFEHYSKNSIWNFAWPIINLVFLGKAQFFKTGIMHGDDMQYMFGFPAIFSEDDKEVARIYGKLATNFVRFGKPTLQEEPIEGVPFWPAYNFENRYYMAINSTPMVLEDYTSSWRNGVRNRWVPPT